MLKKNLIPLLILSSISLCGYNQDRKAGPLVGKSLINETQMKHPPGNTSAQTDAATLSDEPTGAITLRDALSYALMHNPKLAAFSYEIRAAEARALQAGLWPNPELEVEAENVGGTGELSGFGAAETTIGLGQLIELAGKRAKRRRVASLEGSLAEWDYETRRLDVLRQVTQAYVALLAAQRGVELAADLVQLSEQTYTAVAERVEAGKDPPIEKTKAQVALAEAQVALADARIELKKADRRLAAARKELATTWGSKQPQFDKTTGSIEQIGPVPQEDVLAALLQQNPAIARWQTELKQRKAAIDLEESKAIPDPTIVGGYKRLGDIEDDAFVLGLAIPLPVTNRNQGAIREAKLNLAKARKQMQAAEAATYAAFAGAYEALSASYAEVMDIRNIVLPGARSAFDAVRQGYQQGKFDFLTVLDSQRTLFDARQRYLDALVDYHRSRATVESLIMQEIDDVDVEQ